MISSPPNWDLKNEDAEVDFGGNYDTLGITR
jgi:hypothetical protein